MKGTVLVTGGAGYIGSHTCKALAQEGYLPVVYDNLSSGHEWAVKWGPLEKGDILDPMRLVEVIRCHKPKAVIHFAAFAYVGESVASPRKYYRNNVVGTLNVLEAAHDEGVAEFIFSSSCATYGTPTSVPISEDAPQIPINPYGASKLIGERMIVDMARAYGLRANVLRYFNAAGADPDGEIGELHNPETHLIPLVLDAASGRREDIAVFGTDYDTPDGTCVRDYIHVSDLAQAHVKALMSLDTTDEHQFYNLSIGRGFSVREVIDAVERITGLAVPVRYVGRREGDPASLVGDATKVREELGWKPHFAELDEIIRTAWAWHQKAASIC